MFFGMDWSRWLPILTIASTLFTIGAGTLAVFQHLHTKDGKLTRFGYALVLLILISGATTLGLGIVDKRLADVKERADAAERDRRFQSQMGALRDVTGSLSRLQTDMQGSLAQQQRQFDIGNRNLSMSEALQRQSQANTLNVLRRVFAESNRISAERIAIAVAYQCSAADLFHDAPRILEATLVVRSGSAPEVRMTTRQTTQLGDGIIFHGFLGDLRQFEIFPSWRNAQITIRLSGGDLREGTALGDYRDATEEEIRRMENPEAVNCPTSATLLLNGRQVLSTFGSLIRNDYRYRGYAVTFSNLHVDGNRLPRFSN